MSTLPQTFDTTGMDQATLPHAAYLLSQNLTNGTPTTVTGPYADQLVKLAGGQLNSQGLVTYSAPGVLSNTKTALEQVDPTGLVKAAADTYNAAGPSNGQSISSWLMKGAANYSLIAFGAVIAIAALIYSQRDNVTAVVKQVGKVAEFAA